MIQQPDSEITTGIEHESDLNDEDAEVYGFADDGEHAVVWAVWADDAAESYGVTVYNCEAGLCDDIITFTVSMVDYEDAEELAESLATDDPETSVQEARDYWEGN